MAEYLRGYQHMIQHLSIFGFSTDASSSALQCCKELLDNAYEATREDNPSPQIRLELSLDPNDPSIMLLTIFDNGAGFRNLDFTEALNCFTSNRDEDAPAGTQFGRFGCGLSASLLYSLTRTENCTMRIASKQEDDPRLKIADVSFDRTTGKAVVIQQVQPIAPTNLRSGSKIILSLPKPTVNQLPVLVHAITECLYRYAIIAIEPSLFELEVHVDAINVEIKVGPESIGTPVAPLPASKYSYTTEFLLKLKMQYQTPGTTTHVFEHEHEVGVSVIRVIVALEYIDTEEELPVHLELVRYVNSTPLLDYQDEGYTCTTSRALCKVVWKAFGITLKRNVPADPQYSLLNNPKWEISLVSRESKYFNTGLAKLSRIVVMVDIDGQNVPFASIRKTAIGEMKDIFNGCKACFTEILQQMQAEHPATFATQAMIKQQQLTHEYIPNVARSIAKLFKWCTPAFQAEHLEALGLPLDSIVEVNIKESIEESVRDVMNDA